MRLRTPGFRIGAASGLMFSPSGRLLGQVGRQVVAYDVPGRKAVVRSQWHYPHPAAVAFGRADEWMSVRSTTGALVVLDLPSGQPISRVPPTTDTADDSPLLGHDEHLVEACTSGTLRIRQVSDLHVAYLEQHPADMLGPVAVSATRDTWAIAFNRKQLDAPQQPPCRIEVRRWPLSGGTRQTLGGRFGHIAALALTPEGHRLAILEEHRGQGLPPAFVISLMSTATSAVELRATHTSWRGHRGFAWSPSGEFLVVGTDHGHALLDGSTLTTVGHLGGEYSSDAAFSPNGQLLALGYWGHGLVLPVADVKRWFSDEITAPDVRAV